MPCVYLPGPAPAVTVANNNAEPKFVIRENRKWIRNVEMLIYSSLRGGEKDLVTGINMC